MSRLDEADRELIARELSALSEEFDNKSQLRPRPVSRFDLASVARLAAFGAERGRVSMKEVVDWAERAVAAAPSDTESLIVLADALVRVGNEGEALANLERAAEVETSSDNYGLHMRIGTLRYNREDFEVAARAYGSAVRARPTAQSHLYLADAFRRLNDFDSAREHYLAALRRDRLLVDALRGYWGITRSESPGLFDWATKRLMDAPPRPLPLNRWLRPITWRLLRGRYRRHPEDARLHFMIGYAALLRRDFAFAQERLTFAYYLPPKRDYTALVLAVLARGLGEAMDDAERLVSEALEFAAESPIDSYGRPLVTDANVDEIRSPFVWEPKLGEPWETPAVGLIVARLTPYGRDSGFNEQVIRRAFEEPPD